MKKRKIKHRKSSLLSVPQRSTSILFTLMISLLALITLIIFISFTTSVDIIRTVQLNMQADFYRGLKGFDIPNQTPYEYETETLPRLRNYINSRLVSDFAIHDILVANESGNIVFTTLKNNDSSDKYIFQQKSPAPLQILSSSNYSVSKITTVAITKTFPNEAYKDKSYTIYLVVPKPTAEYKDRLIQQLAIFFGILVVICIIALSFLVKSITNPLNTMEKIVSGIAKGDLSGRLDYTRYDEINKLVGAYNMMANALQRLYSSLEAQVQDRTKELQGAYAELQNTQAMMVHSEKMKSLGELVAGIMHEINNPINFIYGNMTHLGNYSKNLIDIIEQYTKYEPSLKETEKTVIAEMKQDCDLDFLKTDMPDLIKSCKEGAERAKNIIQDLKSFSRMEEVSIKYVDVPAEIDTVLNILHNKIKNKAQVHKQYMSEVPKVEAFGGQLNQVFMNILDNAVGAIEKTGDIWIRINTDNMRKNLVIEIEDNGAGMDEETANKVFDPFFTTKPVGQGTGLGMSITYKIIKNHQGDIQILTEKGKGSKFIITLPINIDRDNLKASVASGEKNEQNK